MKIAILTPVWLLGDGLAACLRSRAGVSSVAVLKDLGSLRETLAAGGTEVVLVDVSQGVELFDVRDIAKEWPDVALIALGLTEHRQEVIRCGRAGFTGYVSRDASIEALCESLVDIASGRLACPPEIASGLMRALREHGLSSGGASDPAVELTHRESQVLELIGRGLTNKEIGSALSLSVATVKHHVHHLLEKMGLARRAQAMRRVREAPWIVGPASTVEKKRLGDGSS